MWEQVAQEVAKNGSGITGKFVLDGALLIAALKVVEAGVGRIKTLTGNGKKPGESKTCMNHTEEIEEHGKDIATLKEFKSNAGEALVRIEGKVDRLLERKG